MVAAGKQAGARFILVGGFLGAGKTTAVAELAEYLTRRGWRVGLISNDQSSGLVNTVMLRGRGFAVEEVAGGCFCCRFEALLEASEKLRAENAPDVFVAEPVGSCTDLVATVSYPLRRIYGDRFTTAPLSVMVDPTRAGRVLGIEKGRSLSPKVIYVYRKQLEEADLIIVNKCDAVTESGKRALVARLREEFPRAEVLCCSAREGTGLHEWFGRLLEAESPDTPAMELDYERYAEGEALLGWLNCTIEVRAEESFDADALVMGLADRVRARLDAEDFEIAHLKMTLEANDGSGSMSAVSVACNDAAPDLRESLLDRIDGGRLVVNLRAEADPAVLRRVTEEALEECRRSAPKMVVTMEHMECFRPAKPSPVHRISG